MVAVRLPTSVIFREPRCSFANVSRVIRPHRRPVVRPVVDRPDVGWGNIAGVRAEWPHRGLDRDRDLSGWHEGVVLYQNDDYRSMMKCAELLAPALAHSLYGDGVLRGD